LQQIEFKIKISYLGYPSTTTTDFPKSITMDLLKILLAKLYPGLSQAELDAEL